MRRSSAPDPVAKMPIRVLKSALLAIVALVLAAEAALAQDAVGVEKLTGTLKKIKEAKTIAIGYRDASVPFSYLNAARQPVGYSIELCLDIVEAIRGELGDDTIQIRYVSVDTMTRIPRVVDGTVDLECGTTTNTAERRKEVGFSPIIFVSGTKLLVKRAASYRSYRDLKGRAVAVTPGSTNEAAIKSINAKEGLDIKLVVVEGNPQAFDAVDGGQADAWAGDDAVLYATAAESNNPGGFKVLDEYLSYDPYGLMYRKNDPAFDALVKHTFEDLASTRELARVYEQWFMRKLPSGRTLGIAMSPQLQSIFESMGQPTE
jgi:ABC-type amino acid transport substrate-binding protein